MWRRWFLGALVGTALIAGTSPLFVRSYVPRTEDTLRGVRVYQPGTRYRWRSEGYATTKIGRWGMPGRESPNLDDRRGILVALWGDSQAEGVCVADDEKIASQVVQLSTQRIQVLPFARSGDDCNDWLKQIQHLHSNPERSLTLDAHAFLITELSDWNVDIEDVDESAEPFVDTISSVLPAFIIQTARNSLMSGTDNLFSQLRFRPGPVTHQDPSTRPLVSLDPTPALPDALSRISTQLSRLSKIVDVPIVFLYCPLLPSIAAGTVKFDDPDKALLEHFVERCKQHGFTVLDFRPAMESAVREGHWPRGFHNGEFGVGHYNAGGNRIIAQGLIAHFSGGRNGNIATGRGPVQD